MSATDKAAQQEKPDDNLVVEEQNDGSVAVTGLPPDEAPPAQETQPPEGDDTVAGAAEGGGVEGGSIDPDAENADDSEAIREAKRNRRRIKRQIQRQMREEKDIELRQLRQENRDLIERVSAVERRTQGSEMARIDKAIEDQRVAENYYKMQLAEATKAGNGEAAVEAQEKWYEARRAVEELGRLKQRATAPKQRPLQPDTAMQRLASEWMERNPWYDPGEGDEDSSIAVAIDRRLTKEGVYKPNTPEYWKELDKRLQKRLPHHYTGAEDDDDNEVRGGRSNNDNRSRPRNVVTGSGRESGRGSNGKGGTFTLSQDQVRAMKDAGMWDDPAARARMIRRYANEARQRNQGN